METMSAPTERDVAASRRPAAPMVAGILYAVAWAAGLLIRPGALSVTATDAEVVSAYAGHQGAAIAQVVLTEGVAAVALAAVVLTLGAAARAHGARRLAARIEVTGLAAAGLSLVQCALGLRLAGWVAPDGDGSRAGYTFQLITRTDGVKMLLLAVLAVSGMTLARRTRVAAGLGEFSSVVLAAALTVSGFGYLLLTPALAALAYLSLPLLLIWVAGAGLWLSRDAAAAGRDRTAGTPRR